MKSKELFKQTFVERHIKTFPTAALYFVGMVSVVISAFVFNNMMVVITLIGITLGVVIARMIHDYGVGDNRDTTVNIFMGNHEYNKFVELSLKYLGYETKILDENDRQERDFIVLNDNHLVCISEDSFSLGDIDKACKIAKENDKSLTVIVNGSITSEAYMVAKQGGIVIHYRDDLYNALHKTIKTKGGEPIRECLCT